MSEARKGISPANKGIPMTEEQKEKMKQSILQRTEEDKKKISHNMSISHMGIKQSEESKLKKSNSLKRAYAEGRRSNNGLALRGKKKKTSNSTSHYVGVGFSKNTKKWKARIKNGGKDIHLGLFGNEIDAAKAYDNKSWELYHKLSILNFPEDYLDMT